MRLIRRKLQTVEQMTRGKVLRYEARVDEATRTLYLSKIYPGAVTIFKFDGIGPAMKITRYQARRGDPSDQWETTPEEKLRADWKAELSSMQCYEMNPFGEKLKGEAARHHEVQMGVINAWYKYRLENPPPQASLLGGDYRKAVEEDLRNNPPGASQPLRPQLPAPANSDEEPMVA